MSIALITHELEYRKTLKEPMFLNHMAPFEPLQRELASQQRHLLTQKRNTQNSEDFIHYCFI